MEMFNVSDFKQMISKFTDEELVSYKSYLYGLLANMIANPTLGTQITLIEIEENKRKQVEK